MLKRLLFLPAMLFSFAAISQTGSVSGVVKDADGGESLIGATVIVKGTSKGTIVDLVGNFSIQNVPTGKQTIQVSFVGYETVVVVATVDEGQDASVGEVILASESIGLNAVEIFASVVEDRKTPVAVSSISSQELSERHEGVALADVVSNTPGVYTTNGAGGYGDQEVYIRGFDQSNVAFLVNGIPVNDMENGRMFWSNFAGLNEVTRSVQVQRGLGASKLAVGSIGGTVNMITKPSEKRAGGRIEYLTGTGSWNQRLRFTYNTGQLDGGWAVSFQGSKTTTDASLIGQPDSQAGSVVPGAYTDAYSYYLAVSKTINDKHQIMFWGFGAPVDRGTAWAVGDATRAEFDITEPMSSNSLGLYQGELYNFRQNKIHKPLMSISHYWDINESTSLNTSVYYSNANVYSTQPQNSRSSTFFGNPADRTEASGFFNNENMVLWDVLADVNRNNQVTVEFPNGDTNIPSITGAASQYYLEARYNNHNWIGMISNFRKSINNMDITGGIDLRHYKGSHFARVHELFGGDFVLNVDFDPEIFADVDANKLQPNGIAKKGDKINYNYDGYVDWAAAFGQIEYAANDQLTIFGTATLTSSWYTRVGNYWNARTIYNDNSLGKSETKQYTTYTLKAGVNYRPTNRHSVYANGGYFTRPPFFRNSFLDARYSNQYRDGLETEKILSAEIGYGYRTSKLKANFNAYFLQWNDRTTQFDYDELGDDGSGNQVVVGSEALSLTGLTSEHKGIEVDFVYNVTSNLEINGFVSVGDWKWANDATKYFIEEGTGDTLQVADLSQLKGLPVGTAAQTTVGMGIHYRGIRNTYVGGRWQFADRIPIRYSPEEILEGFIDRSVIEDGFPSYSNFSLYAGRYFDLSDDIRGRLSFSVQNLLDAEYTRWASYFFSDVQRGFGYPRTYTIGLSIEF